MKKNPLKELGDLGQSVWLDYIRRDLITSNELRQLIQEDGLRGLTSNPTIFDEAIAHSHLYDEDILSAAGSSPKSIYEKLSIADVQAAADQFRPLYNATDAREGYVSLEVDPRLAHDHEGTLQETRRLWQMADRPNIFIKIPGTLEGLPAIRQAIEDGININVTLLFGLPRYEAVAMAYLTGIESRIARGLPVERVASVASFFLSRIDSAVDPLLQQIVEQHDKHSDLARMTLGTVAIACAKIAYGLQKDFASSNRFAAAAAKGARIQRLLWASTSTKNPAYSAVKYVEPLIGPDTINTLPMQTLKAYRDRGTPASRLHEGLEQAQATLARLAELGVNLMAITQQLEEEGVRRFARSFENLLSTLETASSHLQGAR